ncbi:hypothetical protein [Serratia sp. Se-RSBMAAmG]|uniref:hypothetical protein n=1 Tax=Serratia sp. Se-RSBMAAmG TaxID=3043305 RepID=UPI0024AFCC3E|nr:hypothetical protein [Serratia sp. Se-RSBMAAmG]MDI6977210.1 hypothetical protein [Serratia sp. Se-RSBMAAmG]
MSKEIIEVVNPLDKVKLKRLFSGEMALHEFNAFKGEIDNRLFYFLSLAAQMSDAELSWFDYSNGDSESESNGYFDYEKYNKVIKVVGATYSEDEYLPEQPLLEMYFTEGLPVEVLWCDAEEKITKDLEDIRASLKREEEEKLRKSQEEALRREREQEELHKMMEVIKGKLTPEELAYVSFSVPSAKKQDKAKKRT